MEILNTNYKEGLITINASKMEETLARYNMTMDDLDSETLETFTKLSEYAVILSLIGLRVRESGKDWLDTSYLLYYDDLTVEHSKLVGRSNRHKDFDAIRVNCLLPEIYYLLAQLLPHKECMTIIKNYLASIKDSAFLTEANGNFQLQGVPGFVLEDVINSESNILLECSEVLELKKCPIKYLAYDGSSITMATESVAYRCYLNHFAIKGFAKNSSKQVYGVSKSKLETMSKAERDMTDGIVEAKIPYLYAYTLICYIGYMCILANGGLEMLPTNRKLYGASPTMTLTDYFVKYYKEN